MCKQINASKNVFIIHPILHRYKYFFLIMFAISYSVCSVNLLCLSSFSITKIFLALTQSKEGKRNNKNHKITNMCEYWKII